MMKCHWREWPLRWKILVPLFAGFLAMAIAFVVISYIEFKDYTIEDCVNYAYGLNTLIADELDVEHINDYIEQGRAFPGYDDIEAKLYKLRAAYPDIEYLYVYQIREDGCHTVFDLDTEAIPGAEPGEIEPFDRAFEKHIPDLLAGKEIPPVISNDAYGYLLTIYTPIRDADGACRCYVAVDYSMDMLIDYVRSITVKIMLLFALVILAIAAASALFTDRGIVRPMKRLEHRAYRDTLTGLKNRAAYDECCHRLDAQIAAGKADFALLMIDVNYLKRVNDTHGHEKGNEYLKNAAELMASSFGEERLYRTGGDEFVAVLKGDAQENAEGMIRWFKDAVAALQANDNLQPWQKVSAAVGMATYASGKDARAEDVLKRADAAMYRDKLSMKAERRE